MFRQSLLLVVVFVLFALIMTGFGVYFHDNGKTLILEKNQSSGAQSTGAASVYYQNNRAAEFTGHHLIGHKNPNALYQGFLAVHFDEMDSFLTSHSPVGRTNAKNYPGDKNTFKWISSVFTDNTLGASENMAFSIDGIEDRFLIREIVETKKDSGLIISVSFVYEFYRPAGDTATFSNVRMLFGYDGDIGNSLGGFSNDSSGYYEDDSAAIVYIFDDSLHLYSGMNLVNKPSNATAGNYALLHQTVNGDGASEQDLDTLLYRLMNEAAFFDSLNRTDVTVYWSLDLGTIIPLDTVRDTVRLEWVNGATKNSLITAAKKTQDINFHSEHVPVTPLPTRMLLYANYPNPFNPATTIKFDLDRAGPVSLKIYNILGQEVRVLLQAERPAGSYQLNWDGRDEQGRMVSSGIYIYRLQTDQKTLTRKMILLK